MSFYNVKLSFRYLLKNRVYSSLIIGGFAIGFTSCILIGLFYFNEKNVNNGFIHHQEIYRLYDAKKSSCNIDYELSSVLGSKYSAIVRACPMDYFTGMEFYVRDEENNTRTVINNLICTDNSFAEVFKVKVAESMSHQLFEGQESFVVTRSLAKKLYGNGSAVGRTVSIGNPYIQLTGKITAVIEDLPENSSFKAELMLNGDNVKYRLSTACEGYKCWNPSNIFIQLEKGADPAKLVAQLNKTVNLKQYEVEQLGLQKLDDIYLSTLPIKDMHFKGNAKLLKIFIGIALLILFLSSINYLNYTTSQQFAKLRNIGIYKTNGAKWKQLASYSFTEVSLGISIAVILAIVLTILLIPYSEILFGKELHPTSSSFVQLLPVLLITVLLVIILNSLSPLSLLSHFSVADFIAGRKKRSGKQFARQALLTFQLAVSIALITLVLGIFKQLDFVKHSDLGFEKEFLLRIDMPISGEKKEAFKQEIDKLPFVTKSAFSDGCPGRINLRMGSAVEGNDFLVNCITIGNDYLETMGIELLKGREFQKGDINNVCLLNETAVRHFGFENIEGKKYGNGKEGGYEIIGITKDFHVSPLYSAIEPVALIYNPDVASSMLSIRLIPGNISPYVNQLKAIWKRTMPDEIMNFTFYDEQFQSMYNKEERLAQSISFFSIVAIVLTCMGILSQIILTSLTRTKEIGIRKVNGAKASDILSLLNQDYVKWVVIAFLIASPVSWYIINRWLQSFAYKTSMSWWIFVLAGVITLCITLITITWQSWRTAIRNPVDALRYE